MPVWKCANKILFSMPNDVKHNNGTSDFNTYLGIAQQASKKAKLTQSWMWEIKKTTVWYSTVKSIQDKVHTTDRITEWNYIIKILLGFMLWQMTKVTEWIIPQGHYRMTWRIIFHKYADRKHFDRSVEPNLALKSYMCLQTHTVQQ